MTLLSYQVFQTVVGQGSFQKAAEILNLTPSAVSHAIASMEQELGFSLFTRNKAGVALTNYGEHLLPYVNAVLNSDESLQQAIAGLNGLKMGNVKVQKRKVQFRIPFISVIRILISNCIREPMQMCLTGLKTAL